jgi:hypothetical protein
LKVGICRFYSRKVTFVVDLQAKPTLDLTRASITLLPGLPRPNFPTVPSASAKAAIPSQMVFLTLLASDILSGFLGFFVMLAPASRRNGGRKDEEGFKNWECGGRKSGALCDGPGRVA